VLELDPVAITNVGGGCAQAATVGEEGDAVETVAAQCSGGDGVDVLPVTTALPHLDRTRVRNCRWRKVAVANFVVRAPAPYLSFL
jgi:hypothetical protein